MEDSEESEERKILFLDCVVEQKVDQSQVFTHGGSYIVTDLTRNRLEGPQAPG
jgi:hypothetical protein